MASCKLRGKTPKPSERLQKELRRMHDTGEYSISNLGELFDVVRHASAPEPVKGQAPCVARAASFRRAVSSHVLRCGPHHAAFPIP